MRRKTKRCEHVGRESCRIWDDVNEREMHVLGPRYDAGSVIGDNERLGNIDLWLLVLGNCHAIISLGSQQCITEGCI